MNNGLTKAAKILSLLIRFACFQKRNRLINTIPKKEHDPNQSTLLIESKWFVVSGLRLSLMVWPAVIKKDAAL
jgi:hypothetical protein